MNEWPSDDVLELVGLTRDEWNKMSKEIQQDALKRDAAIMEALAQSVRRRAIDNLRERIQPSKESRIN